MCDDFLLGCSNHIHPVVGIDEFVRWYRSRPFAFEEVPSSDELIHLEELFQTRAQEDVQTLLGRKERSAARPRPGNK